MKKRTAWALATFIAIIVGANLLTASFGLVTLLGLTATAGTWVAGLAFVARDSLQESGGARWVVVAIVVGAALSAFASPTLALASAVAFAFSEAADWAVYTPLRRKHRTTAALLSNTVGSILDTLIFLSLAGFPLAGAPTQVVVKATTSLVVMGVRLAISRQPVHAAGGGRHA